MNSRTASLLCASLLLSAAALPAAETVTVVVGADAPKLERFAAAELADQFERLFDVETRITPVVPADAKPVVLVGSPATNSAVKGALGSDRPKLSDQGIVLKSTDRGLVVGGGSPVATLWAVYELGHRSGIRYLLRTDVDPEEKQPLKLDGFDVVLEPTLKSRTWRTRPTWSAPPTWSSVR